MRNLLCALCISELCSSYSDIFWFKASIMLGIVYKIFFITRKEGVMSREVKRREGDDEEL